VKRTSECQWLHLWPIGSATHVPRMRCAVVAALGFMWFLFHFRPVASLGASAKAFQSNRDPHDSVALFAALVVIVHVALQFGSPFVTEH